MKFRTEISIPPNQWKISHSMRGIAVGSCFTSYIGNALQQAKFPIMVHPFGTVYNPISIAQSFNLLFEKQHISENDIVQNQGIFSSFLLHSSFSARSKQAVINAYYTRVQEFKAKFQPLDYAIISLGTAWVYEYCKTGDVVSNCHKFPASDFTHRRLTVAEIEKTLEELVQTIREHSPTCRIIFTISPIRHWKNGAHENQISKSLLFVALESFMQHTKNTYYFPAYELVIDELRDYRFYADDMLHPNTMAVQYIQKAFSNCYFSEETQALVHEIEAIHKAQNHKPYHADSEEYAKFLRAHATHTTRLQTQYPHLDFSEELQFFTKSQK